MGSDRKNAVPTGLASPLMLGVDETHAIAHRGRDQHRVESRPKAARSGSIVGMAVDRNSIAEPHRLCSYCQPHHTEVILDTKGKEGAINPQRSSGSMMDAIFSKVR